MKKTTPPESVLRLQAEAKLSRRKRKKATVPVTEADVRRLVHELEVHQIQLEMQNEELERTRAETEAAFQQYADLYDFAPVGYFTLGRDGTIHKTNFAGASLLGAKLSGVIKRRFGIFVSSESRTIFNSFLEKVFRSRQKEICEVALKKDESALLWARIEAVSEAVHEQGEVCRAIVSDITERVQAEQAQRIKDWAIQSAINAIAISDLDGKLNYVNASFLKMWGYASSVEVVGKTAVDFWQFREKAAEVIDALNTRRGWRGELLAARKDGTVFNVEVAASMIMDVSGSPVCMMASFADITERVQAEEALRKSRERFHSLFEDSPIAIWEEDFSSVKTQFDLLRQAGIKDFKAYWKEYPQEIGKLAGLVQILEINQASVKMLGAENKDQVRKHLPDYFMEESLKVFEIELIALAEGRMQFKGEIPIRNLRGERIILELTLNVQPGCEDSLARVLVSFLDITERVRAEEALRESEWRLKDITFSMADWVWEVDEKGVYTYSSQKGVDFLGSSQEDILGRKPFDFMSPEEAQRVSVIFSELMANKAPIRDLENWNIRKNGESLCMLTNAVPMLDKEGNFKGYRGVDKDITERKKIEDALFFLLQSGYSDEDFFLSLARYLANSLDMDYVCIDRLSGDHLSAQTLAIYFDGEFEDNVAYTLKDTPCGNVVGNAVCVFPSQVRHLFPKDIVLQEMLAESYVGTTLWSLHGQPIGLIAIIGRKPLTPAGRSMAEAILKLVAVRAAGELERKQAEAERERLLAELDKKNKELESLIYIASHDMRSPLVTVQGFGNNVEKYCSQVS